MAKIEKNCEHCNESFMTDTREVNRGRGKFCSRTCANSLPRNQSITKICKHCSRTYLTSSRTSKYCSNLCKQKNYRKSSKVDTKNIKYIYRDFKDIGCEICGWKETVCDLHHILEVSKGGTNDINNLISVCPNHHRMIHKNLISKDKLYKLVKDRTISSS